MTLTRTEVETSRGPIRSGGAARSGRAGRSTGCWSTAGWGRGRGAADGRGPRGRGAGPAAGGRQLPDGAGADLSPRGIAPLVDALARELGLLPHARRERHRRRDLQLLAAERPPWLAGSCSRRAARTRLPAAGLAALRSWRGAPRALWSPWPADGARGSPFPLGSAGSRGVGSATSAPSAGRARSWRWPRRGATSAHARGERLRRDGLGRRAARASPRPVAIGMANGDRFFPRRLAERLAGDLPGDADVIDDAYAFTPIDQPRRRPS